MMLIIIIMTVYEKNATAIIIIEAWLWEKATASLTSIIS